jgi:hypothetical protein
MSKRRENRRTVRITSAGTVMAVGSDMAAL